MPIPGQPIMLCTPDGIKFAQYAAIAGALRLQVRTGLKHSTNGPVRSARIILAEANKPAPRSIAKLSVAFEDYRKELWPNVLNQPKGAQ